MTFQEAHREASRRAKQGQYARVWFFPAWGEDGYVVTVYGTKEEADDDFVVSPKTTLIAIVLAALVLIGMYLWLT